MIFSNFLNNFLLLFLNIFFKMYSYLLMTFRIFLKHVFDKNFAHSLIFIYIEIYILNLNLLSTIFKI